MDVSGSSARGNYYSPGKLCLVLLVSCWPTLELGAQQLQEKPFWPAWGGSSSIDSEWDTAKNSSVFNRPNKGSFFQFPQWSPPNWPAAPTVSGLRHQTARSMRAAKNTTRRWWVETKEFLSPFPAPTDGNSSSSDNGGNSWFWWWGKNQEEHEIETVNDFLRQERPRF